uniref:Uncharacterized protein n=1 Tax=Anguilla anguilla TaxID=7936 RepID=A0A0E9VJC9_ANGAN
MLQIFVLLKDSLHFLFLGLLLKSVEL